MIRADYLVDDGVHNLIQGGYKKILFTAPHNLKCNLEKYGMIRADNWKEVYDIITGDK
jgi:5'(3')-deoxyribonucleotidase